MRNLKNENGSITLFVLVSCLFFVASVACVGMYMQSKQTAVDREYRQIRANYEVSIDKLKKSGEILNKNVTLFTEDNVLITIPAGFTVSKESPNVASEGIIITDSLDGNGDSNGNEFVWIPINEDLTVVGTDKEMAKESTAEEYKGKDINGRTNYEGVLYDFTGTGSTTESTEMTLSSYGQETLGYREPDSKNVYDMDGGEFLLNLQKWLPKEVERYKDNKTFMNTMQEDYNEMIDSVKTYGGFYVGRYEMGAEDVTANVEASGKPTSKIGPVTGASDWFVSRQWYGLYSKAKTYTNKKNSVKSSMIWGSQYDAMLNYALTGDDKEKVTATENGHYGENAAYTGMTPKDKILNIFDLEGNYFEWTLEANANTYRVCRGSYYSNTANFSPSSRDDGFCDSTNEWRATRLTLYIKDDEITTISNVQEYGILDRTVTIKDSEGQQITIPKGFTITKDSGTKASEGIVITDSIDENGISDGNEFVWIPCTADEYDEAKDDVMDNSWACYNEYKDNGNSSGKQTKNGTGDGTAWRDTYNVEDKEILDKAYSGTLPTDKWIQEDQISIAKESIGKNGGFYIARYEAGIPKEATGFYTSAAGPYTLTGRGEFSDTTTIQNYKPVSKKGVQVWNWITQPNSKMVAENMYETSSSVGSYLVDSQAWNLICNKLQEIIGDGTSGENIGRGIKDSTQIGNYTDNKTTDYSKLNVLWALHEWTATSDTWKYADNYNFGNIPSNIKDTSTNRIEFSTGSSDDFKIYNIYDMAGNVWEFTTGHNVTMQTNSAGEDTTKQMFCNVRGGSFHNVGSHDPIVKADGSSSLTSRLIIDGFRVVLYIKDN